MRLDASVLTSSSALTLSSIESYNSSSTTSYDYFITEQFIDKIVFTDYNYDINNKNYTFAPICMHYDNYHQKYINCDQCKVISYTIHNVTFGCLGIPIKLSSSSSSPISATNANYIHQDRLLSNTTKQYDGSISFLSVMNITKQSHQTYITSQNTINRFQTNDAQPVIISFCFSFTGN